MPSLEEIRIIKKVGAEKGTKYIWKKCPFCGLERWVQYQSNDHPPTGICPPCHMRQISTGKKREANFNWKGGCSIHGDGYIVISLPPNDFFASMMGKGRWLLEHRLVMARSLGRCLQPWEIVHHKGERYSVGSIENKQDNRIENLELTIRRNHIQEHNKGYADGYAKGLWDGRLKQIQELKARILELESK